MKQRMKVGDELASVLNGEGAAPIVCSNFTKRIHLRLEVKS